MTPPATPAVLASAEVVDEGEVVLGASGSTHGALFGPTIASAGGRLRYGLVENLELVVDAGALILLEDGNAGAHRGVYTGRLGVKAGAGDHVAFFAGLGAGVAPAFGFFGGVDGGFIIAYENPYAVPYFAGRVSLNAPVNPSAVDTGQGNDMPGEVVAAPDRTLVASAEFGIRVPVGPRLENGDRRVSLLSALVLSHAYDGRGGLIEEANGLTLLGGSFGLEVAVGD